MTDRVTITYPANTPPEFGAVVEEVAVKPTDKPDEFELAAHTFLMPLGPGDVVRVEDGRLVEVVSLAPQFIYHVDLYHPADYFAGPLPDVHPAKRISERLFAEWKRDAYVTEMTDFIVVVSSSSEKWINEKVRSSKYVEALTQTRTPDVRSVPIECRPVT